MVRCLPGSGKEVGISLKMRDLFWVSGMVMVVGEGCIDGMVWFVVVGGNVLGGNDIMAGSGDIYIRNKR